MRWTMTALVMVALLFALTGVALAKVERGTDGPDDLRGTNKADTLYGEAGDDQIIGREGPDTLYGGGDGDTINGKQGADEMYGGDATDDLNGGRGADELYGEAGRDYLADGPLGDDDMDVLDGGDDNDVFFVGNEPASKDIIRCGPGLDTVNADRKDRASSDCERVIRR